MNARSGKHRGFSLIELMIVVVIVGILAAVAIPSYRTYVVRTHRAAARSCMLEMAQHMERFYTAGPPGLTYVGAVLPAAGCRNDGNLNTRYTITVGTLAQNTYTLTATPVGVQLTGDTMCGTLTLTQSGARNATGSSGTATCWSR